MPLIGIGRKGRDKVVDKRRYTRSLARVEVTIKRISQETFDEATPVVGKDISTKGIDLLSEKPFKTGDVINLNIKLPLDKVMHAIGVIKWVTQRDNLYTASLKDFLCGVEFTQIADADRRQIEKFISETK